MSSPKYAGKPYTFGHLTEAQLLELLETGLTLTRDRAVVVADFGHPDTFADICDDLRGGGIPFRVASLAAARADSPAEEQASDRPMYAPAN